MAVARPFAVQPTPRLSLELQDYAALPITSDNTNTNTRAQLARVNFMRDEPGGRRFFVNDLNGPLYILDKQKKTVTTYLDFNGRGGRPGLFPKFTFELNFATGLTNFIFDPDYAKNGTFYTLHMEDPATDAPAAPKAGIVAGLDLTGYSTTPAAGKRAYDASCAACHGNLAQGAVKAGMTISIIEEQRGKQPPDLTDDQWDHGSSDAEIFTVIKRGVPPTMMPGFDGRIPDDEIWSLVNYLRRLSPKR